MGGGYIKADLQGLFQHQSATSFFLSHYSSDTNMHTYTHGLSRRVTNTHFDVFFPRCINKKMDGCWFPVSGEEDFSPPLSPTL